MKSLLMIAVVVCCALLTSSEIAEDSELSATRAARYLLSQITTGSGDTPRIFTALSFLKKLKLEERRELKNVLKNELLGLLKHKSVKEIPAQILAQYINAMYAVCEDPRDFAGSDLVYLLRQKFDEANKTSFKLPIILLSLCIARDISLEDSQLLIDMYDDKRNDNTALKALIIITMARCKELTTIPYNNEMKARLDDFLTLVNDQGGTGVHTKALMIQGLNAWGIDTTSLKRQLLGLQKEDGSFEGELIATYSAIPALMNTSLADLQCKSRNYIVKRKALGFDKNKPNSIDLSCLIHKGQNIGQHTITLEFTGKKNLYELMSVAEEQNQLFRFRVEVLNAGKKIISISGIPNDYENGLTWGLYKRTHNGVLKETNDVVDYVFPQDGDHYIFKLEME